MISGFVLAFVVVVAVVAAAWPSYLRTWAAAVIAGAAFAAGLAIDPFKKMVSEWFEHPRQQRDALLANTRMHNRAGRLRRVRECTDAVALGVHPAAPADELSADTSRLPPNVRRDAQADLEKIFGLGGMVIIEGPSTAGKSRLAYECMQTCSGNRWLIVPAAPTPLQELVKAAVPLKKAVIWLDDVEQYLVGGGLDGTVLDGLCPSGSTDVLVLATLRAEARNQLTPSNLRTLTAQAAEEVMQRARHIMLDLALTEREEVL